MRDNIETAFALAITAPLLGFALFMALLAGPQRE